MREYNQLWKDVIEGLKKQGYEEYGGNDINFLIMSNKKFPNTTIKIYLNDYNKELGYMDKNAITVRFTG